VATAALAVGARGRPSLPLHRKFNSGTRDNRVGKELLFIAEALAKIVALRGDRQPKAAVPTT